MGRLEQLWGEAIPVERVGRTYPEMDYLRLDVSHAREHLGWSPGWNLDQALTAVAEWCRGYG